MVDGTGPLWSPTKHCTHVLGPWTQFSTSSDQPTGSLPTPAGGPPQVIPRKMRALQREVKYLGHIVSVEGIATDPKRNVTVKE